MTKISVIIRSIVVFCCTILSILITPSATARHIQSSAPSYTLFESGQVRPLALSPDGTHLYALNTPDARLEIFRITKNGLMPRSSVTVGLEPVAVAVRSNDEIWVVNHLSDSVSIVDIHDPEHPHVVRTLLVGDEPRDIVFGGTKRDRAFITTAHRGQNNPIDPQLTTPGVGRADVWVFDANNLGNSLGGTPLNIVTLFTDTPRALAVSPDGARVYAAGFHTGNRTTTLLDLFIPDGGETKGGLPSTRIDAAGETQPEVGLIVKHNGTHWVDELNRVWDDKVKFSLPDKDVFVIDATANPPAQIAGANGFYRGVGTVLFNMAVNPVTGKIYVSNSEALNLRRFEGPGHRLGRNNTVQGHTHESHITVLSKEGVKRRHLNKHINYATCCAPIPNPENAKSLAQPMNMAVTRDGKMLYLAAFGSNKIGILKTAELEADTFIPNVADQIPVRGGPVGLVLDEARNRLYVLTRFNNGISIVDLRRKREVTHVTMYNPEPKSIVKGRRFLYDASFTSSHGDSSCASCHIFGDFDSLAWDLGNPDDTTINNPGPFVIGPTIEFPQPATPNPHFRALKGPMTTQSLRGMANHGPMHWRGDRTGGNDEPSVQPDSGIFSENIAFKKFNGAFESLVGRHAPLTDTEMQAFTDFILQITYPPNPVRNLDNSLTPDQKMGKARYFGQISDTLFNCNGCHVLDSEANANFGVVKPGFFGTDGRSTFENETQFMKVPHLRNLYQKIGMFGMGSTLDSTSFMIPGDNGFMGDQIRGFGFLHDGSVDTMFRFNGATVFVSRPKGTFNARDPGNPGIPFVSPHHPQAGVINPVGVKIRRELEQFTLAFDNNVAPIVGQQITFTHANANVSRPRINLLIARADAGECDLIVKARHNDHERGYLYKGHGLFQSDRVKERPLSDAELRAKVRSDKKGMTYTCTPLGSGVRMALDRNENGMYDGDEQHAENPRPSHYR